MCPVSGRNNAHAGFCFRFCLPWAVSGEVTCTGRHGAGWRLRALHIEPEISWAWVRIPRLSGTLPQCKDKFDLSSLRFQSLLDQAETDDQNISRREDRKGAPGRG